VKLYQVDAFTDVPFRGNPAAVCLLDEEKDEQWMQNLAAEMNLSETAFVLGRGNQDYALRWFTPKEEVQLCGHATLAAAHVLFSTKTVPQGETIAFSCASGQLQAQQTDDGIELRLPADPPKQSQPSSDLLEALGLNPSYFGNNSTDFLMEVDSEATVRSLNPDMQSLAALTNRGVIVTALSSNKTYDFVSRFFAPGIGIAEDPVTGSAHCALAPYWQQKLGRSRLLALQASERSGTLGLEVAGDLVKMSGKAVLIFSAELHV